MKRNNVKKVKKVLFAVIKYGAVLTIEIAGSVIGAILWLSMSVPDWMSATLTIASFVAMAGTIAAIDDTIEREKKRMAKRRTMREKKPLETYRYL